jgi:hypothetical protein
VDLETPATVAIESTGYALWFHALLTRLLRDKVGAAGKANCASACGPLDFPGRFRERLLRLRGPSHGRQIPVTATVTRGRVRCGSDEEKISNERHGTGYDGGIP